MTETVLGGGGVEILKIFGPKILGVFTLVLKRARYLCHVYPSVHVHQLVIPTGRISVKFGIGNFMKYV